MPRSTATEPTIHYELSQSNIVAGEWRVEAIDMDNDGECYLAIFSGPDAEARAREYADWKSGR